MTLRPIVATLALLASVASFASFAGLARAQSTKRECIDANAGAQVDLKAGHLRKAEARLKACAVQACPATVRSDCRERLDALIPRVPSLVFEVTDGRGNALAPVRVRMDGLPIAETHDGLPFEVDPGEHAFTFEAAGRTVQRTLVVREGERGRHERIVLAPPPAIAAVAEATPTPRTPVPAARTPTSGHGQRVAGVLVGATGVAGLVAGLVAATLASAKWSSSKGACNRSSCPDDAAHEAAVRDHDAAKALATGATVGFVAGGVLVGGGLVLYLTAPPGAATVGVAPGPSGASLVGRF